MNPKEMLEHMCAFGLTTADRKAICTARGFPADYAFAGDLLQHVFLSNTGVKKVIGQLDEKECIFLHLMLFVKREVDLSFFTRIYPAANVNLWSTTFHKKYKIVFDNIRTNLIRRGILIFDKSWKSILEKKTNLELQRFWFPAEFAVHLPSPIATRQINNPETIAPPENIMRKKLAEIFSQQPEVEHGTGDAGNEKKADEKTGTRLHIKDGKLLMNKTLFTEKQLRSWNISCWTESLNIPVQKKEKDISTGRLLSFFLDKMPATHWFQSISLIPLLKIAFPGAKLPDPVSAWMERLCEKGWSRGCLAKTAVGATFYYRLGCKDATDDATSLPRQQDDCLTVVDQNTFAVDLNLVSYKNLEIIAQICRLQVSGGRLIGEVDFISLSHCLEEIEQEPVFAWLKKHLDGVKEMVARIEKRRNKTIIHQNIMAAKISDLGLKIMIEQKFAATGKVISLNDEFIVFPPALLQEIQKLTKKAGHVIKVVNSIEN
ncbi:MAG: hypothetical protein ACKVE4_02005 [Dissulfuribacterales bacterium]